ncbi:MAG: hypothetical protein AABN33_22315 [Acidobacteriota bacterium]
MTRGKRLRKYSACIAGALFISLIISNAHHLSRPSKAGDQNLGAPPASEPLTSIVEQYSPFVYAATDKSGGRQDIISNIDFDGDLKGNNNWEDFDRFELTPTVYYAILETETHYFISYHLFHPRDWNHFTVWLNDTHENDGENFQVVVRKSDGRVVLLWTQAHYRSCTYTNPGSGIESGATQMAGEFQTVDSNGVPSEEGTHACVFVESEGHGIYGTLGSDSEVRVNADGSFSFKGENGLLFRPARAGEEVKEPENTTSGEVTYQLDSITMKLWPLLRDGMLTGDGKLLDGSFGYQDEFVDVKEVPRFYDGNRFSGPFGSDRGISPFALDFSFKRGTLGALFFNPAKRYAEMLKITDPWRREYINYPFAR